MNNLVNPSEVLHGAFLLAGFMIRGTVDRLPKAVREEVADAAVDLATSIARRVGELDQQQRRNPV